MTGKLSGNTELVLQRDTSILGIDNGIRNFAPLILTGYQADLSWAVRASRCYQMPRGINGVENRVHHHRQNLQEFLREQRHVPLVGMVVEGSLPVRGNVQPNDSIGFLELELADIAEDLHIPILFINAKLIKSLLTGRPNASKDGVASAVHALTQYRADNEHINDAAATAYVGFYASGAIRNKLHFPLDREVVVTMRKRFVYEVTTIRRRLRHEPQGEQLDWLIDSK